MGLIRDFKGKPERIEGSVVALSTSQLRRDTKFDVNILNRLRQELNEFYRELLKFAHNNINDISQKESVFAQIRIIKSGLAEEIGKISNSEDLQKYQAQFDCVKKI